MSNGNHRPAHNVPIAEVERSAIDGTINGNKRPPRRGNDREFQLLDVQAEPGNHLPIRRGQKLRVRKLAVDCA